jgi:CRP-like cAMP-binding protein
MDLLERARCLLACSLFGGLAPAVLIRLAERARAEELDRGERRSTADAVWIVARGSLSAGGGHTVLAGHAVGVIRVVRAQTPAIDVIAREPSALVGLAVDDVRDILEEDPTALAAIADRLAALLLEDAP